jgi:hypothetical protein
MVKALVKASVTATASELVKALVSLMDSELAAVSELVTARVSV